MKASHPVLIGLGALLLASCRPAPTPSNSGESQLNSLQQVFQQSIYISESKDFQLKLENTREIKGQKGAWQDTPENLWWADFKGPHEITGYLSWSTQAPYALEEFLLSDSQGLWQKAYRSVTKTADKTLQPNLIFLPDVPPLQQFPIQSTPSNIVASGCVPTAGASLIAYWSQRGYRSWCPSDLKYDALTQRLRQRLTMSVIPDEAGYTDKTMALAGAFPANLAEGLKADATACGLHATIQHRPFDPKVYLSELEAARPVLLSCTVPVPQQPHLSWGHEVVGVGYLRLGDQIFIGVIDNFLPLAANGSPRWITAAHFSDMVTVQLSP